jgi:hypothetical protein
LRKACGKFGIERANLHLNSLQFGRGGFGLFKLAEFFAHSFLLLAKLRAFLKQLRELARGLLSGLEQHRLCFVESGLGNSDVGIVP